MYATIEGAVRRLRIPDPHDEVLPGVRWGAFDELYTPAYWRGQAWQHAQLGTYDHLRLGRTLIEEVAACLLGGFGMRAELGLLAYSRLRDRQLLFGTPTATVLEHALSEPFVLNGKGRRYRFPRQKGRYLSECMAELGSMKEPKDDLRFRDRLAELPGIGLKTASWVVRNYRQSNRVAIVDVHILRAGRHMGLYEAALVPEKHYKHLEASFLHFAKAIKTAAGMLDGMMWDYMRRMPAMQIAPSISREIQYKLI